MAKVDVLEVDQRSVRVGDKLIAFKWLSKTGTPYFMQLNQWLEANGRTVVAVDDIGISTSGASPGWMWHRWCEGEIAVRLQREQDWQDEPAEPSGKYPTSEAALPTCSGNGLFSAGEVFDVGASEDAVIALYFPSPDAPALYFPSPDAPAPAFGDVVGPMHIVMAGGHCGDADCKRCDPLDRMVDGLSVRDCLDHWMGNIRTADLYGVRGGFAHLSPAQLDAARAAWSAELRLKQEQAREKERVAICVDDDRWEP